MNSNRCFTLMQRGRALVFLRLRSSGFKSYRMDSIWNKILTLMQVLVTKDIKLENNSQRLIYFQHYDGR